MIRRVLASLVVFAALALRAQAAPEPRVIEITAKRFQFTPNLVTLKKDEPVLLRITPSPAPEAEAASTSAFCSASTRSGLPTTPKPLTASAFRRASPKPIRPK